MQDVDENFDIEKYNNEVLNNSDDNLLNDQLYSIPESNRSYKNESEDDLYPSRLRRPDTVQGVANDDESFNLLKSGESYDNLKQRGTAGFGE
jgi:hypothetical protein